MNNFIPSSVYFKMSTTTFRVTLCAFAIMTLLVNVSVQAQSRLGIAATVNDEMISVLDIESRLSLSIYLSKLENTLTTRRRLGPQILRNIIDDRLKLQVIRKNKISVSQAEIIKGIRKWENQSGLKRGDIKTIVQRLGIDKAVIAEQVETQLGWLKLMRKLFLRNLSFSEEEIEDIVAEEISQQGQPEFLVSEIFLPINRNTNSTEVSALAERLIEQIANGAKFSAIARNFSQSATAAVGGSLGWVRKGSLPYELKNAVEKLYSGEISSPIKTLDGIYILQLVDKRLIDPLIVESQKRRSVLIQQIHFELPPSSTEEVRAKILKNARKISQQANSCKEMEELGKKFGSSRSGSPGEIEINKLSPQIQKALEALSENQVSTPIEIEDGFLSVMLCKGDTSIVKKLTKSEFRNKVVNQLMNERISLSARQYLRSLRRTAVIDIRM